MRCAGVLALLPAACLIASVTHAQALVKERGIRNRSSIRRPGGVKFFCAMMNEYCDENERGRR